MDELKNIPHIESISHRGPYAGAEPKRTATFQERAAQQNKIMPSLESAILASGLKDGMTITTSGAATMWSTRWWTLWLGWATKI